MGATNATRALDAAGVGYHATEYDPPPDHRITEALLAATGFDPDRVGKTLVARLDDERMVVAVVPVSSTLDLKGLARAAGAKRATMSEAHDVERATGYVVGGIAPVGHRRSLPVFVDTSLATGDVVHVSGGKRGLELTLAPDDLVRAADATVVSLTR